MSDGKHQRDHGGERPLFGSGRAADVYNQGDGTVLRRYRSDHDCKLEGRTMTWLRDHGVPVPKVHTARGREIVMDLIDGPTMIDDLGQRPWMLVKHAKLLARLQQEINELQAPSWFPTHDGVMTGTAVVHLDLHPMNVLMGREGPVVIDWTNAARGEPAFDAAMTYVLVSTFESTDLVERLGQRLFVSCFSLFRGRRAVQRALHQATNHRLLDPNVTDGERQSLKKMLAATRQ
ncbi:MAG: aminoglycoside phosphotransferase family protein [bacterium]|nr:aminoglycoside phosphotransferase family protein [bacterium]